MEARTLEVQIRLKSRMSNDDQGRMGAPLNSARSISTRSSI